MRTTIYMGLSADGFVARPDDGLDFLTGEGPPDTGDGGFPAFLATVDVLLMGRRTFDVVRRFPDWPYGDTPVVVLSRQAPDALLDGAPATVSVRSGPPAQVLQELAAEGAAHVYVDGASVAQTFLSEGLIDHMVLTYVPVLIGSGVRLFGALPADVRLRLVEVHRAGDAVQVRYDVVRGARAGPAPSVRARPPC